MKNLKQIHQSKFLLSQVRKFFSAGHGHAAAAGTANTKKDNLSQRFHEIYLKEHERLKKAAQAVTATQYKVKEESTPISAYVHPYHSEKFPLYWSTKVTTNLVNEAMGTEPVSPHYESFAMSRRAPILGAAFLLFMNFMEMLNVNSFYGKHAIYEVYTLMVLAIGTLEIRYLSMRLPNVRLSWYYDAFIRHELTQAYLNWFDSLEEKGRIVLAKSKAQIDYYLIHKEYAFIKKRLISTYLENERLALSNHFQERTHQMLSNINNLENSNIRNKIREIADESLTSVLNTVKTPEKSKDIMKSSFQSALEGLRQGKMEYKGDTLLPMFIAEVQSRTAKISKISPEEENRMFALSESQRKYVIDLDQRSKNDYLSQAPEVSTAIKNTETYKNIITRIKSRVESTGAKH